MVARSSRSRRSSLSTVATSSSTKRRTSIPTHEKKKIAKPLGICSFCMGDEDNNANNVPEDMISCAECGNCGHPSCLKYSEKLVKKIKTTRWQCLDCKRCTVCNKADESLLFCDYCDAAVHPKCCNPPLYHIPKNDFACHKCRHDGTIKSSEENVLRKTPSTRSLRSNISTEDETPIVISRPVAQLIDGMSNFFLPKKLRMNNIQRQQSVQKAMSYLRKKTSNQKVLKRLHATPATAKKNEQEKNQLLARSILASSKTTRIRRKPLNFIDRSPPNSLADMNTSSMTRRSFTKKNLISELSTPSLQINRRSGTHPIEEKNSSRLVDKRKRSISPVVHTPIAIKKRMKKVTPVKKSHSTRKRNKSEENQLDSEDNRKQTKSTVYKRRLNLDLSKYKSPPGFLQDSLPDTIAANDVYLFLDARKNSTKLISDCSNKYKFATESIADDVNNPRWPPYIVFGSELIKTWYSSSYPQEYARVPCLFICEFCLKYMKCEQVYDRHRTKCQTFHPPANEIYHKDDLSVFEVDGNINRIYCQNLCLLAKLFLDHKTLYYDVEPFLFYVLTKNDSHGCHFLGYFSKEKHCPLKYNLSCITVLPHRQRQGYGRFLIELSYLLSKKEGQIGTPERPLSVHGAQTYESYWKIKIAQCLLDHCYKKKDQCTLKDLMNETGMAMDDIIDTLQNLRILTMKSNEKPVIYVDVKELELIMKNEKLKHAHWVLLDREFLRFTPVLKPLFLNDDDVFENQLQEIQIIFKNIESDTLQSNTESIDGSNPINSTETIRYIRRRKFGRKRRSIYVKYRVSNKNDESNSIPIHEDEHSQEYISRRRDSTNNEATKNDDDEEVEVEENKISPIKSSLKQPTFKQLTIDQFLKRSPSISKQETNFDKISEKKDNDTSMKTAHDNSEKASLAQRTKQLSNSSHLSKSDTDLVNAANGISNETLNEPILNNEDSLMRQLSDGTLSSNDSLTTSLNTPLPLKKRAWTSLTFQTLMDLPLNSKNNDQLTLSRETSLTTSSSLSDTLVNPLMISSSSINSIDDETKLSPIESDFATTIEPIKEIETTDNQPPSSTSPKSMIISQSNHFNYSKRANVAKQQHQSITTTNVTYNSEISSYPYPYSYASSMDMPTLYFPSAVPMNYMPYYPSSSSPMYVTEQQICCQPNGAHSMSYTSSSPTSYSYSTSPSSFNRRY